MSDLKKDISLLVVLGLLTLGIVMLGFTFLPSIFERFMLFFEPGLGLKMASIISFFVVTTLFIVFAVAAGDSLIGEIQFMIGGFLLFFFIFTLMIAWVF